MAFRVEETVFRFKITVDDSLFVESGEGEEDLCDIETSDVFGEHFFCVEVVE